MAIYVKIQASPVQLLDWMAAKYLHLDDNSYRYHIIPNKGAGALTSLNSGFGLKIGQ